MPAMTASLRTWRKTVYLDKVHPIPAALVFNHRAEHPKRSVVNAFREVMFTGHTLYVQVFHTDGKHLAVVSQSVDYFVKDIFPLITNTLVQACYLSPDFLPIGRIFCLPVQAFLKESRRFKDFCRCLWFSNTPTLFLLKIRPKSINFIFPWVLFVRNFAIFVVAEKQSKMYFCTYKSILPDKSGFGSKLP